MYEPKQKLVCDTCGSEFMRFRAWIRPAVRRFCSQPCQNAALINRIEKRCKTCTALFLVRPSEDKKFTSCPDCAFKNRGGEKNANWKGGVTPENLKIRSSKAHKDWSNSVRERDNYTCQDCGKRGGDMHAHHIKSYALFPDLRLDVENGKTLCIPCHIKTYRKDPSHAAA